MSEIERREEAPLPAEWYGDERQPFDRLEDESSYEHFLFAHYRAMGVARSVKRAAEELSISHNELARTARRHAWTERAMAFDDHVDRLARKSLEQGIVDARNRHVKIAMDMQDKVAMGLAAMDPLLMSPKDLVYAMDVAVKLEQRARGDVDTKRVEFTGKGGGPIEVVNKMDASERDRLLLEVQAAIAKRFAIEAADNVIDGEIVEDGDVA